MSVKLVSEVLEFVRATELKPTERMLLLVIAERASEHDRIDDRGRAVPARTCWPSREYLCEVLGLSDDGLRKSLQRLAAAGLEVRVPVAETKQGRPIYALRGHQSTYRLPELVSSDGPTSAAEPVDNSTNGSTGVPANDQLGSTGVPANGEKGGNPVPESRYSSPLMPVLEYRPNHYEPLRNPSPLTPQQTTTVLQVVDNSEGRYSDDEQRLIDSGVDPSTVSDLLALAVRDPETRSPVGRLIASPEYRDQMLESLRADQKRRRQAALNNARRTAETCEHGEPGGLLPTEAGQPVCPLCRRAGVPAVDFDHIA